jgi:hypothetical protein
MTGPGHARPFGRRQKGLIMQSQTVLESRTRKGPQAVQGRELPPPDGEPVHCQPVFPVTICTSASPIAPMSATLNVGSDRVMRSTIG